MAETKNWALKAGTEVYKQSLRRVLNNLHPLSEEETAKVILSHAPVVDAEKLAEKMIVYFGEDQKWDDEAGRYVPCDIDENDKREVARLITDNMTLDVEWKIQKSHANKVEVAELGSLKGKIWRDPNDTNEWWWQVWLYGSACRTRRGGDKKSTIQACETALKKILAGVKG